MFDRAIPRSYRTMQGFGVHTFRLVNEAGESRFVKFHWTPVAGTHSLVWDEAVKISRLGGPNGRRCHRRHDFRVELCTLTGGHIGARFAYWLLHPPPLVLVKNGRIQWPNLRPRAEVPDLYPPAIPFWAASAIRTTTSRSAVDSEPHRARPPSLRQLPHPGCASREWMRSAQAVLPRE
jgi:hypothetical protein